MLAAWLKSDAFPRILPFALFMLFVAAGGLVPAPVPVPPGEWDARWIYAARALIAGIALVLLWHRFEELRSTPRLTAADWLLALIAGVGVLVIWVMLDEGWITFELGAGFDPRRFGSEDLAWPQTIFRLLGLAIVVPIAEELFWRSFLMRWLERQNFLAVAPGSVGMRALVITSVLFALEHSQWLAGLIAGLVYGWLYIRTGKLWVPVIAHAVTNGLLGGYILYTRDWRFW
ncbi:MAG: CAAX prenyl protease-related protein [Burkholderiales bacterium]|nr:CAAX prenyl protease-related protein [Burkholderiales bacterium]